MPPSPPPPPPNNNFSVVVAPIPFFLNFILFYTQILLILILIHVQYLQNVAFFFEAGSNGQSHSSADPHNSMKKSFYKNFSSLHWEGKFPTYPFNAIWKTLVCLTFLSWGVEIISTYFSVWLWTVTQFNTHQNEMPLKVLLIIGNGFLISMWKYSIWISKNESIFRTTAWRVCWLLFCSK